MHYHPILLVQTDSLEEAKRRSEDFCDCECEEHAYFDYGGIVSDNKTEWNKPFTEVKSKLPLNTYVAEAQSYIARAHEEVEKNSLGQAGYSFYKAGQLLQELFCTDCTVFNIEHNDYNREVSGDDWYAIEADLHC